MGDAKEEVDKRRKEEKKGRSEEEGGRRKEEGGRRKEEGKNALGIRGVESGRKPTLKEESAISPNPKCPKENGEFAIYLIITCLTSDTAIFVGAGC